MVPYEAFLSAKPVMTTHDAGGPLEIVRDRETGLVVAPDAAALAEACAYLGEHVDEAKAWGRAGQGDRRARHLGRLRRRAARAMKVAYYSPLPPSRSGIADYSALLLPALRERIDVVVAEPGKRAPDGGRRALPRRQRPRRARLDRRRAAGAARRRRAARVRPPPPDRRHHDRPRQRPRRTSTRWSASSASPGGCSASACSTTCCRCSGRRSPSDSRSPASSSTAADGLIVHSSYVARACARRRLRRAASGASRTLPGRWRPSSRPADVAGEPLIGCFGFLNMNKRIPQLLEAFAALRRRRPGARLLLVGAVGRAVRPRAAARAARPRPTASMRIDYVPEERMWSLMAACDVLVNLRYPTMGETSGSVIRGALARQAAARLRRRLVQRAARRRRAEDPGRRVRGGDARGGARAGGRARDRSSVPRRGPTSSASTRCRASPTPTWRRSRWRPAATRSTTRCCWRIAEAAAEVGHRRRRRAGARGGRVRDRRVSDRAAVRARCPRWRLAGGDRRRLRRRCGSQLARRIVAPWIMVDEIDLLGAREVVRARTATSSSAASPSTGYGFVYPALIAPAWRLFASRARPPTRPRRRSTRWSCRSRPCRRTSSPAGSLAAGARARRRAADRAGARRCSTRAC